MSAKSLLRAGIASPRALRSPSTPKSILKRPPPLPLSSNPVPLAGRIAIVISPSPGSAHVHFPPSPALTATFSTHSPNSYDRGAINISPNPLELPAWGSRVYSPGSDTFGKLPSPNESNSEEELTPKFKTYTPTILSLNSPTHVENFPKSPSDTDTKPTTRAGARFQAIVSQPSIRPVSGLGEALKAYPRSPYPSAPASPAPAVLADKGGVGPAKENIRAGRFWSRSKTLSGYGDASRISRGKKVPPAITIIGKPAEMVSSPLRKEFLTPVQEFAQHTATVANAKGNVADASLTQAFWQSISVDDSVDMSSPCITSEDPVASGLFSPGGMISPMIFATKEGVVWSPPRPETWKKNIRDTRKSDSPRGTVMSPSPEDPFSAFPSFTAVLSLDHGTEGSIITYPPPAVTVESSVERR
ncbi:hypothetical protein GYMLUDRAFT_52525 [Collybiopsis luxurians FD-317 M1]|nr:hypothetical protein GYMLUDRAFT_52525 [Collybiopsis luxurians FD-317 M1]